MDDGEEQEDPEGDENSENNSLASRKAPFRPTATYCACWPVYDGPWPIWTKMKDFQSDPDCPFCEMILRGAAEMERDSSPPGTDFGFEIHLFALMHHSSIVYSYKPYTKEFEFWFRLYEIFPKPTVSRYGGGVGSGAQVLERRCADVRSALSECRTHHEACRQTSTPARRSPTRLIKVSGTLGEPKARLVQIDDTNRSTSLVPYIALSYCWGGPQGFATTRSTLQELTTSIDMSRLSATVRDAVQVAIGVGVSYIWIDALCIVQDDPTDKAVEIARMGDIYAGATFTLAAVSAKSSAEGFLVSTDPPFSPQRQRKIVTTYTTPIDQSLSQCLALEYSPSGTICGERQQPLNRRAWTLQEAMLSPVLVSFYEPGYPVHIRCATTCVATTADWTTLPPRVPRFLTYPTIQDIHPVSVRAEPDADARMNWTRTWHEIVQLYSGRHLTERTDKLSALAAVAAECQRQVQDTYLAGLWSKTLLSDLLWHRGYSRLNFYPGGAAEVDWVAPSWSWASRNHTVSYGHLTDEICKADAVVMECTAVPAWPDNPTGALQKHSAVLSIKCRAISRVVPEKGYGWEDGVSWDDEPAIIRPGDEVWFVLLVLGPPSSSETAGLILQEVGESMGVFRRVGMASRGILGETVEASRREFRII
ncbi:heterokaryon incompatibility protein-domain-containing protein [Podospora australis]|uniref:Heterokaryon incompatibility protein-domain-containing protein n=1 Tax=Podospora australis TaxID=1536484 RepID=A0AAN6WIY2_9PEZI|nr:heterokaryon incompatibility protein-domain-containing protein [Podospora australis]